MYGITVIMAVIFMVGGSLEYVRRAFKKEGDPKKTDPAPATWILMFTVFVLSTWMYWHSPDKSWEKNVGLTSGLINVTIILAGVIVLNARRDTLKVAFNPVQIFCLILGGLIFLLWLVTDETFTAYGFVQGIAVIAYVATVVKMWGAKTTTEPIITWVAVLLASLSAVYPAWVSNDKFAQLYLVRAVPSTAIMIYLIWRVQRKMAKSIA